MAILDFLKKQFIDIIEWTDDSRDTISFRFPDNDATGYSAADTAAMTSPEPGV